MTTEKSVRVMRRPGFRALLIGTGSAFTMGLTSAVALAAEVTFNIPAQPLANAIIEFSRQSDITVAASFALVQGKQAPGIQGTMEPADALEKLLVGSNLKVSKNRDGVLTIQVAPDAQRDAAVRRPRRSAVAAVRDELNIEEIIVTGSRIVREGYEAPTPLTVIGTDMLDKSAEANIVNTLNTIPAAAGTKTGAVSSSQLGQGGAGTQSMNLRGLGPNRVLVLLDGQRVSPSTYGAAVDVANFPSQLVSRVDVVTGGTSAVYGSDAVAGVVNFILDRNFVGVRGEVSGGITNYGDNRNYKIDLSGGFGFADNRGHALISGEHMFSSGVSGDGGRAWNRSGYLQFANPNYTPTNGQPQNYFLPHSSVSTASAGGLIVSGPLKGTAFGAGGKPYTFNYGSIVSGANMSGGDWQANNIRTLNDLDPAQSNQNLFTRVSYDVADDLNVFAQWTWAQNTSHNNPFPVWLPGSAAAYVIQIDNAYLPASVRAAMVANNITSFGIGSWNQDMPKVGGWTNRLTNRVTAGAEGRTEAFGTIWHWNAYYAYGGTRLTLRNTVPVVSRLRLAFDAVVNPANGQIVCRSTLTDTGNGCKPWNPMGVGVNNGNINSGAFDWLTGGGFGFERGLIEETTMAASVTGEPFSSWAGPVSMAVSFEHRKDEIHTTVDPFSLAGARFAGNYAPLDGQQSVTEGALETLIPLAKDESWAEHLDLSLAARFTGYELSGYVTTWKVGATYMPVDAMKLRVTRSRDIRAPNLQDLFQAPSIGAIGSMVFDRFRNENTPGSMVSGVSGNPTLVPEKADTTGIGVVISPRFIDGFTISVDYWDVSIAGAIQPITAQQVMDSCYNQTIPALCANIVRNPDGTVQSIATYQINLAEQDVEGIDLETSYSMPVSRIVAGWRGDLSFHGLMTFYLRNYQDTTFVIPTDIAGQNSGSDATPSWKFRATATYSLDPVSVALTARGVSSGKINNAYIECTSGCPVATTANPTINNNRIAGRFYVDANVNYKISMDEVATADLFLSARNVFNASVPPMPVPFFYAYSLTSSVYDAFGTVYRAGIRFKM